MKNSIDSKVGDICTYWNKLVIVHRLEDEGWAEVIKIKNPSKPYEPVGAPFSVRTNQLDLVQSASAHAERSKRTKREKDSL